MYEDIDSLVESPSVSDCGDVHDINIVALLTNCIPLDKFISSIWVAKVMPWYLFTIRF